MTDLRIGITDAGDARLDLDWRTRMAEVHGAILITKSLTPTFLQALAPFHDRVLVHVTCTGFGGGPLEPGVPIPAWTRTHYDALVDQLPAAQTVLRLDPIFPTPRGLAVAETVLRLFQDSPVQRVRFSYVDMYPHVTARFQAAGLPHPYAGRFGPSPAQRKAAAAMLEPWRRRYTLESCAECGVWQVGCLSAHDAGPLRFDPEALRGRSRQRPECLCAGNKVELLARRGRCARRCLYCYWRDPEEPADPRTTAGSTPPA